MRVRFWGTRGSIPVALTSADIRHKIEQAFRLQQSAPCFPVDFSRLAADIEFVQLKAVSSYDVASFRVTPKLQRHTGDSYGYRFERETVARAAGDAVKLVDAVRNDVREFVGATERSDDLTILALRWNGGSL